jgi:hypothetical protein
MKCITKPHIFLEQTLANIKKCIKPMWQNRFMVANIDIWFILDPYAIGTYDKHEDKYLYRLTKLDLIFFKICIISQHKIMPFSHFNNL